MTKKKQHIGEEDFQRYLENKMTDAERNAFERELQKYPFEAEALEGLEQISPKDLKSDLQSLQTNIIPVKRKTNYRYWAAAATLLLLISTGIIWFQLKENPSVSEITENKTPQEEVIVETEQTQPEEKIQEPTTPSKDNNLIIPSELQIEPVEKSVQLAKTQAREKSAKTEITESNSQIVIRGISSIASKKQTNEFVPTQKLSQPSAFANNVIRGKIISVGDSLPIAGVIIKEKGGKNGVISDVNGNFELKSEEISKSTFVASFIGMEHKELNLSPDSENIILMVPDQLALEEVVTIGYGNSNKKALTGNVSRISKVKNKKAQPVNGFKTFKSYLENEALLPQEFDSKRELVRIRLKLNSVGEIIEIKNRNQADSILFERAKFIIQNGPAWNPEIKNGSPTESEVDLKIIFRK